MGWRAMTTPLLSDSLSCAPCATRAQPTDFLTPPTQSIPSLQVIPALEPFYMGWEKNYNSSPVYEWMKQVPWLPVRAT